MKHVSILIPEGDCSLTHIEATHQIFSEINKFVLQQEGEPLFNIELVGLNKTPQLKKGCYSVTPLRTIDELEHTDLVIIPAIQEEISGALQKNKRFLPWLCRQYRGGAELASLCLGSFLLADTGLLEGRKCTTHWSAAAAFREMFPDVLLVPDRIITDDAGIYSSGGALSFQNLLIYLIEKYAGRDMAILASKIFMIDMDRYSQSPFTIFNSQKSHDDEEISRVQQYIEQHLDEKMSVEQLAAMLPASRRNFERRFKKATSNSVLEYLQRVRIEAAKKSLESSRLTVSEVMYDVGYSDMKAFRTTFKKITGLSPLEYRKKYNPRAVLLTEA